jgi:hypothetical protein
MCRLVLTRHGRESGASGRIEVKMPVRPWEWSLEPERLAADSSIRYCGDLTSKVFYGRTLKLYEGRLYFTFKDTLETDVKLRGFACIGLVGNLYRVPPGSAYENGEAMALRLKGTAFDWASRPKWRKALFQQVDSDQDEPDAEGFDSPDFVRMGRGLLLHFMSSPEARRGTYMIWTGGHAGLIRDGVLYECKPSGKGFTNETYTEGLQSAVRRYDADALESQLKQKGGPYRLARLP